MKELKDISDLTVCVVDHGVYFPVAQRLAHDCKRVLYQCPNGEAFETFAAACRGDGHADVELCDDFWLIKNEIDLFVFPDCDDCGDQFELRSQGFPVWGSGMAAEQEQMRGVWIKTCKDLGLPMPKTHVIVGLTNLRLFFQEHEGETFHVKISRYRGDMETWKACERSQIRNKLDVLAIKFGPFQDRITFYVQEPVETDIEGGADTYFVKGHGYPDKVILGYERKGESYFATWKHQSEMPPEIWEVSNAIAPLLDSYGYCNMVSTEVRVKKDESEIDGPLEVGVEYKFKKSKSYLLDPCLRFPSPAGEEELEMYRNFSEIIYMGARGELVQPEMAAKFCGEAVIGYTGDREGWKSIRIPEEARRWVKLYACGYEDGAYHFPPSQDPDAIGCAVSMGDKPKEVLDGLKRLEELLKDSAVEMHIEPLADLFKEIEGAEEQGIPFTNQEMPEPAAVLEG